MRPKVPLWYLLVVLAIGFLFLFVTEITLVLGMLILPFSLYYLVNLKHKSAYHFWLTFISFLLPVFFFMSPFSWISLVLMYALAYVLEFTLRSKYTQEYTIFIATAVMTIIVIGGLNLLQVFNVIPPLGQIWASLVSWYNEQMELTGMSSLVDVEMINTSLQVFYMNLQGQITIYSMIIVTVSVLILRWLLGQNDEIKLWPAKSFKDWAFPRPIMYLFFVFFLISFFMSPSRDGVFYGIVSNIVFVLEWLLFVHGLAFVYFVLREKKVHVAISILLLIPLIVLRPITMLIGLFEMVFRIRMWIIMKRK
ncbi:MAG TPA: YybS family protein [Aliicoccus persicus]|uniref:YybS family protein n=1 Tax=Aliicoccus persicus TaxID=930138 RepID=A0A921JBV8_9STAP|nr:YybS family protein [Aliicoccus persicus]